MFSLVMILFAAYMVLIVVVVIKEKANGHSGLWWLILSLTLTPIM